MAACALSLLNGYAQAGVSLDRTRIIITEKESSSSANLSNTSPDIPFLAQSWVEDEKGNVFMPEGGLTVRTAAGPID